MGPDNKAIVTIIIIIIIIIITFGSDRNDLSADYVGDLRVEDGRLCLHCTTNVFIVTFD